MQLEKVKEVLFTTDDNFIVYENDGSATSIVYDDFSFNYTCRAEQVLEEIKNWGRTSLKLFSTKEAAEHWVNWNKPKYSKKEMEACYEHALTQGVHGCSFKSYMNWMENYFNKPKL
jgi:hypothetical protein